MSAAPPASMGWPTVPVRCFQRLRQFSAQGQSAGRRCQRWGSSGETRHGSGRGGPEESHPLQPTPTIRCLRDPTPGRIRSGGNAKGPGVYRGRPAPPGTGFAGAGFGGRGHWRARGGPKTVAVQKRRCFAASAGQRPGCRLATTWLPLRTAPENGAAKPRPWRDR